MTISLAIITSLKDLKDAKRVAETLIDKVDEVCITIADKKNIELKDTDKIKYSYFEWCDDFSKARTFNFKQCSGEWILWLDADDKLEGGEKLGELIKHAKLKNISGYAFPYHYNHDENGNCIEIHYKMQFIKNDGHCKWAGAIHEDLIMERQVNWTRFDGIKRIHNSSENDTEKIKSGNERNLRILEKEFIKNPKEPRTMFYLGRAYIAMGELQKTIDILNKYLESSGWDDERYEANLLIGQCFVQSKQYNNAIKIYNEAILEKEAYPDAYIQKGLCYLKQGEYKKALYNFKISFQLDVPSMATFYNPMNYTRDVFSGMAICYLNLAILDKALLSIDKALKYDNKSKYLIDLKNIIVNVKHKQDIATKYVQITQYLEKTDNKDKILPLLYSAPVQLKDDPKILAIRNTYQKPKKWNNKSITIFCGISAEPWKAGDENGKGIGGSETAVIELTKRLVKKGYEITVYNGCDVSADGKLIDGVLYKNYWEFNVQDEFNILWVWRLPEIFDYDIKANYSLLDLHDVISPLELSEKRLKNINKIFVKTNYHRSLFPEIDDSKFEVIGNGIDLKRFENVRNVKKEPYRFIYSSTPDRGLDILLEYIWDDIKKEFPEAELHIYYGWNTFEKLEKNNPERMQWMAKVKELMKKDGVINHGRVNQKELADDIMKTSYWLYCTAFAEIYCITACEMQAGGCIPIHSGYAALAETVKAGITIKGDIYDPEYHSEYIKEVIKTVKNKDYVKKLRNESIEKSKQFSWDTVVELWEEALKNNLINK